MRDRYHRSLVDRMRLAGREICRRAPNACKQVACFGSPKGRHRIAEGRSSPGRRGGLENSVAPLARLRRPKRAWRRPLPTAPRLGASASKFSAKIKNHCGIVDPKKAGNDRACRSVSRAGSCVVQVLAEKRLTGCEQKRRRDRPFPHVAPAQLHVRHVLEDDRNQHSGYHKGDYSAQSPE